MAAENKIETYLVKEVKKRAGEIRKLTFPNHNGAPDRMVWIPTWEFPIFVELKAPGKDLEDHQRREHIRLCKIGLLCTMINSKEKVDMLMGSCFTGRRNIKWPGLWPK